MRSDSKSTLRKAVTVLLSIYLFLLGIHLLGHSLKFLGRGFAEALLQTTSNPFAGLIIGIVATSIIQSSSTTTSMVVALVAGDALTLRHAIPIIMGANIGTTITNILVSLGHVTSRAEFRRAFTASIVHDFFNVCSVAVLFPLELRFHAIEQAAQKLEQLFAGAGGLKIFNPLKFLLDPAVRLIDWLLGPLPGAPYFLIGLAAVFLFAGLACLVRTVRSLVLDQVEVVINNYLFKNDLTSFSLGILLTATVQSSSVTTSLVVPLAGAGLVSLRQVFPYTLGANVGTTVTATLAALTTQNHVAVAVAFSHLCFNLFGILIFYPLRVVPITLAQRIGGVAARSYRNLLLLILCYLLLHLIPVACLLWY